MPLEASPRGQARPLRPIGRPVAGRTPEARQESRVNVPLNPCENPSPGGPTRTAEKGPTPHWNPSSEGQTPNPSLGPGEWGSYRGKGWDRCGTEVPC